MDSSASDVVSLPVEAFTADAAIFLSILGDAAADTTIACVACFGFRYLSTRTGVMGSCEVDVA